MSEFTFVETSSGLQLRDAGPSRLTALLRDFDQLLAGIGVDLDTVLAPGLSAPEVRRLFASVDLIAPDELVVWYGWHNGLRVSTENTYLGLSPFVLPADLAWSIADYRYQLAETVPIGLWSSGWLCMESDGGALAVYCSGNAADLPRIRRQHVEAYDFLEQSADHQIVSLCTMVALWMDALRARAIWPRLNGGFLEWEIDGPKLVAMDSGRLILF